MPRISIPFLNILISKSICMLDPVNAKQPIINRVHPRDLQNSHTLILGSAVKLCPSSFVGRCAWAATWWLLNGGQGQAENIIIIMNCHSSSFSTDFALEDRPLLVLKQIFLITYCLIEGPSIKGKRVRLLLKMQRNIETCYVPHKSLVETLFGNSCFMRHFRKNSLNYLHYSNILTSSSFSFFLKLLLLLSWTATRFPFFFLKLPWNIDLISCWRKDFVHMSNLTRTQGFYTSIKR